MQSDKKKRIVFDDTDIRHAKLKIRLQHDGFSQSEFFRALITGYLNKDVDILSYMDRYKDTNNLQSKKKRNKIKSDIQKSDELLRRFGIKDEEIENIFDLIAEQHPDL